MPYYTAHNKKEPVIISHVATVVLTTGAEHVGQTDFTRVITYDKDGSAEACTGS